MANLASEVSRVLDSRNAGDKKFEVESLERANRIIDDVGRLPDMQSRKREIETLSRAIREPDISAEYLRSYFDSFVNRLLAWQFTQPISMR